MRSSQLNCLIVRSITCAFVFPSLSGYVLPLVWAIRPLVLFCILRNCENVCPRDCLGNMWLLNTNLLVRCCLSWNSLKLKFLEIPDVLKLVKQFTSNFCQLQHATYNCDKQDPYRYQEKLLSCFLISSSELLQTFLDLILRVQ